MKEDQRDFVLSIFDKLGYDLNRDYPDLLKLLETGMTFEENAM